MAELQWIERDDGRYWVAKLGTVTIGQIWRYSDNSGYGWQIDGVSMRWIAKGHDDNVQSYQSARRAFLRSWRIWRERAGLE
jgi:hypothetical protein